MKRKLRRPAKARTARRQRRLQMEQFEGRWLLHVGLDWQPSEDDPDPLVNVQLTALLNPSTEDTAEAVPASLTQVDQCGTGHPSSTGQR